MSGRGNYLEDKQADRYTGVDSYKITIKQELQDRAGGSISNA